MRKASTTPYIAHLMGVASLVLEYGGDEDMAIAALLHDVVEDCGGAPMLKEVRRDSGRGWRRLWMDARILIRFPSRRGASARKITYGT